jgi:hypothetical protein
LATAVALPAFWIAIASLHQVATKARNPGDFGIVEFILHASVAGGASAVLASEALVRSRWDGAPVSFTGLPPEGYLRNPLKMRRFPLFGLLRRGWMTRGWKNVSNGGGSVYSRGV